MSQEQGVQRYKAKWKFTGDAAKKQLSVASGDVLVAAPAGTARAPKGWVMVRGSEGAEGFVPEVSPARSSLFS